MSEKWEITAETIQNLKSIIKGQLDCENAEFHEAINGENPVEFFGLKHKQDYPNKYYIDISDVLFWHDPQAYLDELSRWKEDSFSVKYNEIRDFLNESYQKSSFTRLYKAIKKQNITPFIGAGVSKGYGFPLWREILSNICKKISDKNDNNLEVMQLINDGYYLEAADKLYTISDVQVDNYLLNNFDVNHIIKANSLDKGIAPLLLEITNSCIITTNFDNIIEYVFHKNNKPIEGYIHGNQEGNQFAAKFIQGERCILKLHGNFDSNEGRIFCKQQYDESYGKGSIDYTMQLPKTLRQIFISRSILFLGCSLSKDRIIEVFEETIESKNFDIPQHFALMPENCKENEDFLLKQKIQPIWYPVLPENDHSKLELLLRFAIDCAKGKVNF